MLTNIGHRVGHQSGLDESSRQNSIILRDGFAIRVYFVFSKIGKHTHTLLKSMILSNTDIFNKKIAISPSENPCGKPAQP